MVDRLKYWTGELPSERAGAIRRHIPTCAVCKRFEAQHKRQLRAAKKIQQQLLKRTEQDARAGYPSRRKALARLEKTGDSEALSAAKQIRKALGRQP